MAKVYDPIMCMMVDEQKKAQDELSLAQKKQVVIELKGFLKKSYNFSDESEYARAYEDLRHMFTTGSRKSISGLFENTVKRTGAKDSKVIDVAHATQLYINSIVSENKVMAEKLVRQAEQDDEVPENELKYVYKAYNDKFGYKFHDSASALDKAISTCDAVDDIYVRRSNEYYVNVKLGKSNPQISATISRILNKDKRVDGVLSSPGNWDVAIEGKDNAEYIKKILSGVGNIK